MLDHRQALRIFELADAVGYDLLERICTSILAARKQHPEFAASYDQAARSVESEFYEFKSQAMLAVKPDGSLRRNRVERGEEELLDLITTAARMLGREYPQPQCKPCSTISFIDPLRGPGWEIFTRSAPCSGPQAGKTE